MKTQIPGLIIRPTEIEDLHSIYMLGSEETVFASMTNKWDAANLSEIFSRDNILSFTAARKKKVAGFIIGTITGNAAEVLWIFVIEKFRNRGIGTALLDRFTEKSKKSGAVDFFVALFPNKSETENFFSKKNMIKRESFIKLSGKL